MLLTRRQTIVGLGVASAALLSRQPASARMPASRLARALRGESSCLTTRQTAEGPFYIDGEFERSDIIEDRRGIVLDLVLDLVEVGSCAALVGGRIDIWHSDADGCFSGFQGQGDDRTRSTVGQTFLRGMQTTNAAGRVRFKTIFPGWYSGRAPHVHFKVHAEDRVACVGQIYFPDDISRFVFATVPPYRDRKRRRDTYNSEDQVMRTTGGSQRAVSKVRAASDRLIASTTIGISRHGK